ncbi:hypothetical protein [Leifsonia sp. C5G2]|uniref:hypothetical protein n=1 Tax=Leifsonia sp. C5G2 TaxID=2735269 RepID=UPI0015855D74|nr:hypothetical protein [Leifsonia sp. C5G2]NUU07243.1 hypothetical protein [Leifsonia sp. C5G2]
MVDTDTVLQEPVTLVLEEGIPARLDWHDVRYYPDRPPLPRGRMLFTRDNDDPLPTFVTGWQLTASSIEGDSHVFVVISGNGGRWWLTDLDPDEAGTSAGPA